MRLEVFIPGALKQDLHFFLCLADFHSVFKHIEISTAISFEDSSFFKFFTSCRTESDEKSSSYAEVGR